MQSLLLTIIEARGMSEIDQHLWQTYVEQLPAILVLNGLCHAVLSLKHIFMGAFEHLVLVLYLHST